jgi:hypothetical protein
VQGAIDGTHISIVKPSTYPEDYYYHKVGGYNVIAQAIVDCKKKIIDVYVSLLGSVNDLKFCINIDFIEMHNIMIYLHLIIQPFKIVSNLFF